MAVLRVSKIHMNVVYLFHNEFFNERHGIFVIHTFQYIYSQKKLILSINNEQHFYAANSLFSIFQKKTLNSLRIHFIKSHRETACYVYLWQIDPACVCTRSKVHTQDFFI